MAKVTDVAVGHCLSVVPEAGSVQVWLVTRHIVRLFQSTYQTQERFSLSRPIGWRCKRLERIERYQQARYGVRS